MEHTSFTPFAIEDPPRRSRFSETRSFPSSSFSFLAVILRWQIVPWHHQFVGQVPSLIPSHSQHPGLCDLPFIVSPRKKVGKWYSKVTCPLTLLVSESSVGRPWFLYGNGNFRFVCHSAHLYLPYPDDSQCYHRNPYPASGALYSLAVPDGLGDACTALLSDI
ncbi:hypothetical protein FA13DRAFT_1189033 [Coprinellus micaceus]|uniref:Uncharacterized protein n=1 Tax=Coprinellus micaceus TaxID=71717 RepID=A0A4Y7SV93_COPMI|nr:hypothetical protein FA13DRAFT_1189033 [Coprinellus micaceus]